MTKGIVSRIEFAPYGEQTAGPPRPGRRRDQPRQQRRPGPDRRQGRRPDLQPAEPVGQHRLHHPQRGDRPVPRRRQGRHATTASPGSYDQFQTLENDALRAKLGLDRKTTGLVVHAPDRDDADYPLKEWDLITRVGDHDVDNTGMVRVTGDLRLPAQYLVQKLTRNGTAPPDRGPRRARRSRSTCRSSPAASMLIESLRGRYPSYFIYGPLAFTPVTAEFLAGIERAGDRFFSLLGALGSPLVLRRGDRPAFPGEELVVVAAPMFPHRIGQGVLEPVHPGRQGGQRGPGQEPPPPRRAAPRQHGHVHHDQLLREGVRDHRLRPQGGPRRDRGRPERQRHPPARQRRPDRRLERARGRLPRERKKTRERPRTKARKKKSQTGRRRGPGSERLVDPVDGCQRAGTGPVRADGGREVQV